MFRIFISSVQREFSSERKSLAAYIRNDAILGRFFEVFIFEEAPAQDRTATGIYLSEVDRCDIYLGLHGSEYGNVDGRGVSATEREYERAAKRQKSRICFLKRGEVFDPRQQSFIRRINSDVVRKGFSTYDELRTSVYAALAKYLESKNLISVLPFDASSTARIQLKDLSTAKIRAFLNKAREVRKWNVPANAKPVEVLDELDLIGENGEILNPAGLLFGKRPQHFFRSSHVKCAWFLTAEEVKPIADHKIFEGDVFEMADAATNFVLSHLNNYVGGRDSGPTAEAPSKFEIPERAIKEAIVNAICHRDYTSSASVQVMLFKDRLEVWSPGPLPKGMTLSKFYRRHKSYPANPFLAYAMFLVKYIEETGTGSRDVISLCAEAGLPAPKWIVEDGDDFRLVIKRPILEFVPNKVPDKVPNKVPDKVPETVLPGGCELTAAQRRLLAVVVENPRGTAESVAMSLGISDRAVRKGIRALKDLGLIERCGSRKSGYWKPCSKPSPHG